MPLRVVNTGLFGAYPIAARDSRNRLWAQVTAPARRVSATSRSEARMPNEAIFEQILIAAREFGVTEVEAIINTEDQALTRFANNVIHQNMAERTAHVSVRPVIDGRTARASTNRTD